MGPNPPRHIIVLGGGIVGSSISYYLLTSIHLPHGSTVTLIERTAIAHGASSRAAGIIASAWHSPDVIPLAELSWDCYEELNGRYDGAREWDWRTTRISGVDVGKRKVARSTYRKLPQETSKGERQGESWLNGERYDLTGDGGTASMHPGKFCTFLHARCTDLGLRTHIATPTSLSLSSRTLHISSSPDPIAFDTLVLSAGPWSAPLARSLELPVPPISNLPGHSLLLRPAKGDGTFDPCAVSESIFAGLSGRSIGIEAADAEASTGGEEKRGGYTPSVEFVTRPSGVVYFAGENSIPHARGNVEEEAKSPNHLPADPSKVIELVDQALVNRLLTSAAMTSPLLDVRRGAVLEKAQLCYRPTTPDGDPLIGRLGQDGDGLFVATGHGPWGITLGPGTGKVMADLILGIEPSIDLSPFAPSRFGQLRA